MDTIAIATFLLTGASTLLQVTDLNGTAVDPLRIDRAATATVLLFTLTDCPISNKYAPEVQRLHQSFAARGVRFWLVYPNPDDTADAIRDHVKRFHYSIPAVRDPRHELVARAKATIAPEAAVFDRSGRLAYRGRIDDRFVAFGVERRSPTRRDLEDALTNMLAGRALETASSPAVGCYLADFR